VRRCKGIALLAGALCLASGLAFAQVVVTPLPGEPTCYAPVAGQDSTMFLRANPFSDCAIFSSESPCLARREFPADGPDGKAISLEGAIILRPSVTGDGASVYFTGFGFEVCGMNTASEDDEGCFGRDSPPLFEDLHSIAVSPSGSPVSVVPLDDQFEASNVVRVLDAFTFSVLENHVVLTPGLGGNALRVGQMDFSQNGRWIIADALNPALGEWAVYAIDRTTGQTRPLVTPEQGLQVGNATFAQTSDDYITFDAVNTQMGSSTVYAANVLTGAVSAVATSQAPAGGYPHYTGDDSAIVFTESDPGTNSLVSLDVQPLAGNRLTPFGPRSRWLTNGGVGVIYRRGTYPPVARGVPTPCPEPALGLLHATALLGLARLRCAGERSPSESRLLSQ